MIRRFVVVMMAALPLAVAADVRVVEEIAAKVNGDIVTRGELDEQKRELDMFLRQERHLKGVELADAEHYLRGLIAAGVDAVLVQDVGICRIADKKGDEE